MNRPPKLEELDQPQKPSIQPLQREFYPSPSGSASLLHSSFHSNSHQSPTPNLPPLSSILGPPRAHSFSPVISNSPLSASQSSQTPPFGLSVAAFLDRLGLSDYTEVLVSEGFDRIESLFDIQEEDLNALNVKRGHRRLIQRELATLRGVAQTTPLTIFSATGSPLDGEEEVGGGSSHRKGAVQQINRNIFHLAGPIPTVESTTNRTQPPIPAPPAPRARPSIGDGQTPAGAPPVASTQAAAPAAAGSPPGNSSNPNPLKRRYRRHPKPDPNAPSKPVSAFVAFSSQLRNEEEFRHESFASMSRLVGERWQALPRATKDRLEARAADAKETYAADLAAYRLTAEFEDYNNYLKDFKIKNGIPLDEPLSMPSPSQSGVSDSSKSKSRRRGSNGFDEPLSPRGDRLKRERVDEEDEIDYDDRLEDDEDAVADAETWEEQAAAARVLSRGRTPARLPPPIE